MIEILLTVQESRSPPFLQMDHVTAKRVTLHRMESETINIGDELNLGG
jgi:hypothetical protein